jgi:hypothetical protein
VEVRHNTTLLEQAIALVVQRASIPTRQAEADAAEKLARAVARRRLATGAAIAMAAIGIGLGVLFGFWKPRVGPQFPQTAESDRAGSALKPKNNEIPFGSDSPNETKPPTIDYEKFARRETEYLGRSWQIEAGHHYATDTDKVWTSAWCYTVQNVDGVLVKVDLVQRDSPTSQPRAPVASPESLARVGLNDSSALELATKCPWLDGRVYDSREFFIPYGRNPSVPNLAPLTPKDPSPLGGNSTPNPLPSYVAKDGFDMPGNDFPNMPLNVDTQSDCESKCNETDGCVAYVFNKPYKKCFLKNSLGTLFENEVAYAGYKDTWNSPTISSLQFRKNTGFVGIFYRNLDNIRYVDCVMECEKDQICLAFNYDYSNKQCTMLRSINNAIPMPTVSSGVKGPLE